jgi:hypothetical protein
MFTVRQQFQTFLATQVEVPSGRGRPPVVVDKDESLAKVVPQSSAKGNFLMAYLQ